MVYVSEDERVRAAYEHEYKAHMDYLVDMNRSRKEGIEQGVKQKALDDAKKLKAAGVDIKIIADCVGLTVEEVEKL